MEARQVSYYIHADFQPLKDQKNLVTFKICGNDKIEYLALGEKYEIIGKAVGADAQQDLLYQCLHLVPIENVMSKFLGLDYDLSPELYQMFNKR